MHLTNTRVSLLSRVECCCHETSEDTRIVDVEIYVPHSSQPVMVSASSGQRVHARLPSARPQVRCSGKHRGEEEEGTTTEGARAGSEAHSPCQASTHLRLSLALYVCVCVFVRIDAYIELVHMRTPVYPICSHANDRRRVSLSRDPETPGFHNLDLDDLTSRRRRLVLLLDCCEASIRTRSAVKAKIDTNASLYF